MHGASFRSGCTVRGDVGCGPVGGHAARFGIMDGHLFSVKPAKMVVPPFGDGHAVLHEHATHGWVRADATLPRSATSRARRMNSASPSDHIATVAASASPT